MPRVSDSVWAENHSKTKRKIMAQSWHNFSSQAAALISAWVKRMDNGLNQLIRRQISSRSSPKFMAQLVTEIGLAATPAEPMLPSLTKSIWMRREGIKSSSLVHDIANITNFQLFDSQRTIQVPKFRHELMSGEPTIRNLKALDLYGFCRHPEKGSVR